MAAVGAAVAMAEATAVTEEAEAAIEPNLQAFFDLPQWQGVRSFPECPEFSGSIWNHFKMRLFPLHRSAPSNISMQSITEGFLS